MTEIEIGGRKLPMRATIGAWKRFEETSGKRVADLNNDANPDVLAFCELAFHFVVAGCKANGTEFKMTADDFLDTIEISEMQTIADAIADVMGGDQKKRPAKRT